MNNNKTKQTKSPSEKNISDNNSWATDLIYSLNYQDCLK